MILSELSYCLHNELFSAMFLSHFPRHERSHKTLSTTPDKASKSPPLHVESYNCPMRGAGSAVLPKMGKFGTSPFLCMPCSFHDALPRLHAACSTSTRSRAHAHPCSLFPHRAKRRAHGGRPRSLAGRRGVPGVCAEAACARSGRRPMADARGTWHTVRESVPAQGVRREAYGRTHLYNDFGH